MTAGRRVPRCPVTLAVPLLLLALALVPGLPLGAATDRPLRSAVADLQPNDRAVDVTFVVGGDNRPTARGAPQPRVARQIFDEIGLLRPDLVLWSGDTIYGYCDSAAELDGEYDAFLAIARRGATPLFNAPGNHELHSDEASCPTTAGAVCAASCLQDGFTRRFGPLYGSFDHAGVHFIALDTEFPGQEGDIAGDQLAWLRRDLEQNKEARAIFVFAHTQFYTSPLIDPAEGRDHQSVASRALLHELFRRYPVRAVFAGHEHLFWHDPPEQHDFLDYFVAAGGGAPSYAPPDRGGFTHYLLVRVRGDRVSYDVIEPGRLYVEPAERTAPDAARAWLINGTQLGNLTLGGIEVEVPADLGGCADLDVATDLRRFNGQPRAVPVEVVSCTPGGTVNRLRLRATGVPQGSSVPVVIRRRPAGAAVPK
jgi:hypothetical protein